MGHFQQHFTVDNLWVAEHVGQVIDRPGGNADGLQIGDPIVGIAGEEEFLQQEHQLRTVVDPGAVINVVGVLVQVHSIDALAEAVPQAIGAHSDVEIFAIFAHERLIGHQRGMGSAEALRSLAGGEVIAGLVGHPGDLGIQHGQVDILTLAVGASPVE